MIQSLTRGAVLPGAVYVTVPTRKPLVCPPSFRVAQPERGSGLRALEPSTSLQRRVLQVHLIRRLDDRGPVEKYLGAIPALAEPESSSKPRFVLVVDDDHEYDPSLVAQYSAALRRAPDVAFTVQSPPRELKFQASIPIVYGSRGVGVTLDLLRDGLPEFASAAFELEPICRVVDDVVVSFFLATRGIDVQDVPGFSFDHRPWLYSKWMHRASKTRRLRGPARTEQNALCHDKLLENFGTNPEFLKAIKRHQRRKLTAREEDAPTPEPRESASIAPGHRRGLLGHTWRLFWRRYQARKSGGLSFDAERDNS